MVMYMCWKEAIKRKQLKGRCIYLLHFLIVSLGWEIEYISQTHKTNYLRSNPVVRANTVARPCCFKNIHPIWYKKGKTSEKHERRILSLSLTRNESHGTGIKLHICVHVYKKHYNSWKCAGTSLLCTYSWVLEEESLPKPTKHKTDG